MSFDGTHTSRRALILGMTNTDQIGMQQARAPQAAATAPENAERLPDAGDGGTEPGADGGIDEATGLSAAELAEFESMRTGTPEPADDDVGADDGTDDDLDDGRGGDDGAADPTDATGAEPAPASSGKEKTPAELAAQAAEGKKPAPKNVSYGKYQRELKKANDTIAAAAVREQKYRDDMIRATERLALIDEAIRTAQQPAPAIDPEAPPANPFDEQDVDPTVDYAEAVLQERRRNKYVFETAQGTRQEATASREDNEMRDTFTRDFQAQAAVDPNLPAAYQYLKDSRLTEICISEFDKDPNDKNEVFTNAEVQRMVQIFNSEEKYVVGNAIKQGKSPAMAIMKLARSRGFRPQAASAPAARAAPAAAVPALRNGNGAAPPVPVPAAPSAAQALAELAANKEAGRSLSDGGGAPPGGLSMEIMLKMGDEEFAQMIDNMPQYQLDALMGKMPLQ